MNRASIVSRLQQWLFFGLVLLLPLGTRKLIYNGGLEFGSFFIYATDLLVLTMGFLYFWKRKQVKTYIIWLIPLILFLVSSLISSFFALSPLLSFIHFLELLFLTFLFLVIKDLDFNKKYFISIVAVVLIFQSILAIGQFAFQGDFGLQVLGEARLDPLMAGVAKIEWSGLKLVRAYGTFPHPNVLAAFLIFGLFLLFPFLKKKFYSILYLPFGLGLIALFLTFSRLAIGVGLLALIVLVIRGLWCNKKYFLLPALFFISLVLVLILLFNPFLVERFSFEDQGLNLRLELQRYSLQIIRDNPVLGVGLGSFVAALKKVFVDTKPWMIQPVHNIFLLIAVEVGVLGSLFFIWFLAALFLRFRKRTELILVLAFVVLALADHYFWTFQQGQLLWWLGLGLLARKIKIPEPIRD